MKAEIMRRSASIKKRFAVELIKLPKVGSQDMKGLFSTGSSYVDTLS
jgi:hypothetical protein